MRFSLTEQLSYCDEWMERNKPVEWPSLKAERVTFGACHLGWAALWTRGISDESCDDAWAYEKAIRPGHWSVLEFSWFCFGVTGISRIATHELVRHRHMSFMQESTRAKLPVGEVVFPRLSISDPLFDSFYDEEVRYAEVGGTSTSILIAANSRAWAEMLRKRLCLRAAPEIRYLAWLIAQDLKTVAPLVYACAVPDCDRCEEASCQ